MDFTYIDHTASIDYDYDRAQLTDLIRKAFPQAAPASGQNVNPFWQHYLLGYDTFGNMTRVQVCASSAERAGYTAPITLATYEYEGNVYNGRLAKMTYGNKDSVSYTYDAFDRQRTAAYNDVDRTTHEQKNVATYHYDYSSDNALTRQYATDSSGITEQYSYQYDSLGRLIHSRQSTGTGALIQSTQHMYDAANRMTSQTWQFGTGLYHQQYSYTGVKADGATNGSVDGTISAITTTVPGQSVITSTYGYNDLRQLTSKGVTVPDQNGTQTKVYDRSYTYDRIAVDSGNWMGTRLASTGYTFGSSSRSFTYTYDKAGNITKIVTDGTSVPKAAEWKEYTYDAQGQLVSEKNSSKTTFLYAYDTAGNIRSITKDGTVTKSFGYTNASWPDLLTSVTSGSTTKDILYEGQTRTSDLPSSGNPVTYYNGKDYAFTWTKGRQLAKAVVDGKTVEYTYDMSGVRTSKTVNGTTYNYTTLSGKVMRQQWDGKTLEFVYDDGNQPFAMIYNDGSTSTLYYYVLNAQGDVIALLNSAGALVASYNYGAWGNYSVHGADGKKTTDATFIGHINPLRYRGYYYDRETRLYYLQSRYYDFANCRFINADTFATTDANGFLSANMFAYCENNPIMLVDQDGGVPVIIAGALIGGLVGAISGALSSALQGGDKSEIMAGALSGMVTGFVAGVVSTAAPILATALDVSGVAMLGAASAVSGAVGTLSSALSQKSTKGKVDWGEAVLNGGLTAIDTFASRGVGIIARGSGIGTAVCTTVQATANLTFGSMLGQIQGAFKTTFGSGRSRRRAPRKRVIRHSRYRARWRSRYRF
ncbi:MAG: RHS repeat domain-containing protein [Oscillospiraceae bacterium]